MRTQPWPALKPGDIVDVVLPAGKPHPGTLRGIPHFLKKWGLQARMVPHPVGKNLLCADEPAARWSQLKKALQAKDSKLIWCVRGGYGSIHLLDSLKKMKPQPIKAFIGFSDITTLHTYLNQEWGWSTVHAPNIDRFALSKGTAAEEKRIKDLIFGKTKELSFILKPLNASARRKKLLKASVVGGNLITLQAGFGTSYSIDPRGQFLFVEDIGERAYKVDRVFEHMRQLGLFKNLRALVLGQFTEGSEPNGRNILPIYFKEFAAQQSFPVLSGLPSGHGNNQWPLPLGTKAELHLGTAPYLVVSSGVKRN